MTDDRIYQIVVNHEEQYSIWDAKMDIPTGWSPVGVSGSKAECLTHIEQTWTDITPLSVRKKYAEASA
ncbi:MbtH family protein [Streptomyces sp. NRRL B-1347]|uniref:MbtH family protein n=1 Tax=Streptomyces sp. NRRL B-1347 TaxID=1476877 RepID=UPI0004C71BD9|nr:MbtH family protein [Streptomyces sp. NRRL B-1347]